jgi:DNA-binding transcriptional regulator YdaS (Cro superfamily)
MSTALMKAAEVAGGMTRLAEACRASVQTVSNWRKRGVPVDHCAAIEQATDRQVMRWDLRPDDWHRIWPELIGQAGAPQVKQAA